MPRFSVVIPVFNRPAPIRLALESVFAQTLADYEVLVIDDGSTDGTWDLLQSYQDRIRALRQANAGPGAARNLGIAQARGEYVCFLDSDDQWLPWTLATYAAAIDAHRPAFLASRPLDVSGNSPAVAPAPIDIRVARDFFAAEQNPLVDFTTSSVAIRTDALRTAGGFAQHRMNYEDMDLWFRLGAAAGFAYIASPVCAVRQIHESNIYRQADLNIAGALHMIESEKAGRYPGGSARRRERRGRLAGMMRAASLAMLRAGESSAAWQLYRATLPWHLGMVRLRYLLGFPMLAARASKGRNH